MFQIIWKLILPFRNSSKLVSLLKVNQDLVLNSLKLLSAFQNTSKLVIPFQTASKLFLLFLNIYLSVPKLIKISRYSSEKSLTSDLVFIKNRSSVLKYIKSYRIVPKYIKIDFSVPKHIKVYPRITKYTKVNPIIPKQLP